jgi:hypothetical protein
MKIKSVTLQHDEGCKQVDDVILILCVIKKTFYFISGFHNKQKLLHHFWLRKMLGV